MDNFAYVVEVSPWLVGRPVSNALSPYSDPLASSKKYRVHVCLFFFDMYSLIVGLVKCRVQSRRRWLLPDTRHTKCRRKGFEKLILTHVHKSACSDGQRTPHTHTHGGAHTHNQRPLFPLTHTHTHPHPQPPTHTHTHTHTHARAPMCLTHSTHSIDNCSLLFADTTLVRTSKILIASQ